MLDASPQGINLLLLFRAFGLLNHRYNLSKEILVDKMLDFLNPLLNRHPERIKDSRFSSVGRVGNAHSTRNKAKKLTANS